MPVQRLANYCEILRFISNLNLRLDEEVVNPELDAWLSVPRLTIRVVLMNRSVNQGRTPVPRRTGHPLVPLLFSATYARVGGLLRLAPNLPLTKTIKRVAKTEFKRGRTEGRPEAPFSNRIMNLEPIILGNTMAKPTLRRIEQECHFGGFCSECAMVFIRSWGANAKDSEKAIREQFLAHLQKHHQAKRLHLKANSALSRIKPD